MRAGRRSSSVPLGALDEAGEAVELGGGELLFFDQGVHDLLGAAAEEGADEVTQGGGASSVAGDGGAIDVAGAVGLVLELALFLEEPKRRPDRRVGRRVREIAQ